MDSKDDRASWDTPDRKQAALLTDYQETREEIRQEMQFRNKRVTQGIAAVGLLIAYGVLAEEPVAPAFIPVIIAFISILTMIGHESVLLLGRHVAEIEAELPYETFEWELKYGEATPGNERTLDGFWKNFQRGSVHFVSILTYLVFVSFGYFSVEGADYPDLFDFPASIVLLCLYGLVTASLVIRYKVHRQVKAEIRKEIQAEILDKD